MWIDALQSSDCPASTKCTIALVVHDELTERLFLAARNWPVTVNIQFVIVDARIDQRTVELDCRAGNLELSPNWRRFDSHLAEHVLAHVDAIDVYPH